MLFFYWRNEMLTQERLKELLHYDPETGLFTRLIRTSNRIKVGDVAGTLSNGYVSIYLDGKPHKAHRLAWLYVHGAWPSRNIDHRNRNPSHNMLANLRDSTQKENMENTGTPSSNTSGIKGVSRMRGDPSWNPRWIAKITSSYKQMHLGCFGTPEEASAAYESARDKLFTHHKEEVATT